MLEDSVQSGIVEAPSAGNVSLGNLSQGGDGEPEQQKSPRKRRNTRTKLSKETIFENKDKGILYIKKEFPKTQFVGTPVCPLALGMPRYKCIA
jgi:hypothetical protein